MSDERFENGYLRCPKGPGNSRPHTWKRGKRVKDVCFRCGMTRAQVYGIEQPTIHADQWVRRRPGAVFWVVGVLTRASRGYCEKLGPRARFARLWCGGLLRRAASRGPFRVRSGCWSIPWSRRRRPSSSRSNRATVRDVLETLLSLAAKK